LLKIISSESEKMIAPKEEVEKSLNGANAVAYRILLDDIWAGRIILSMNKKNLHYSLDLLLINADTHGKGIGLASWNIISIF